MTVSTEPKTRVLLLVEDDPRDATLVRKLLDEAGADKYQVVQTDRVSGALATLGSIEVDVILLDLRLPDSSGVESVRSLREAAGQIPIVVLTGDSDERVAAACIDAGADDYLAKDEVGTHNLRRAIGYAITRIREAQLRELQQTLQKLRSMSSASQGTTVTAALAGSGAVSMRNPDAFRRIVTRYLELLEPYRQGTQSESSTRLEKERVVAMLGDAGAGPRDLLDAHVAALDETLGEHDVQHSAALVVESRLLALEMMGLLVDYYRVGHRRRFLEGASS